MLQSRARFLFHSVNRTLIRSFLPTKHSQFRFEIHKGFGRVITSELGKSSMAMDGRGEEVELLSAVNDHHGGVIVEMKDRMDAGHFHSVLRASLDDWRQKVITLCLSNYKPTPHTSDPSVGSHADLKKYAGHKFVYNCLDYAGLPLNRLVGAYYRAIQEN